MPLSNFHEVKKTAWDVVAEIFGLTLNTPISGTPSANTVLLGDGSWGLVNQNRYSCGRLSLTSGTAVTTADVTAATSIKHVPYRGNSMTVYDSSISNYKDINFSTEGSITVPSTTNNGFDCWVRLNSGALAYDTTNWTNNTTRATALATDSATGIKYKTGDQTRSYIGSALTTGVSGQTEDSVTKRYLWNHFNRVWRPMYSKAVSVIWTYTTNTFRQMDAAGTPPQINFIQGLSETPVWSVAMGTGVNDTTAGTSAIGIGLDSTTTDISTLRVPGFILNLGIQLPFIAVALGFPSEGYHYATPLEKSHGAGITTWVGVTTEIQSGILGWLYG